MDNYFKMEDRFYNTLLMVKHILVLVVGYSDQEMEWFSSNRW